MGRWADAGRGWPRPLTEAGGRPELDPALWREGVLALWRGYTPEPLKWAGASVRLSSLPLRRAPAAGPRAPERARAGAATAQAWFGFGVGFGLGFGVGVGVGLGLGLGFGLG